jgi:putative transposon-encoded protein
MSDSIRKNKEKEGRMCRNRKLEKWVSEGLISAEQKEKIIAFEGKNSGTRVLSWLTALGVQVMCLGLVILTASEWQNLSSIIKLCSIGGVLLIVGGIAGFLYHKNKSDAAEKTLMALFLLLGPSIWLVSRILDISFRSEVTPLGIWALLGCPLVWVCKKAYVIRFWVAVLWFYIILSVVQMSSLVEGASLFVGVALALLTAFAYHKKRESVLWRVAAEETLYGFYLALAVAICFLGLYWQSAVVLLLSAGVAYQVKNWGILRTNIKFWALLFVFCGGYYAHHYGFLETGLGYILCGAAVIVLVKILQVVLRRMKQL